MSKYKLTISILTMNRSEQLRNAIESCLKADLPKETQFVVVDNASTDDTESVVAEIKKDMPYDFVYQKESVNRGAGMGRNIGFDIAQGEYIYFMDDDEEIPEACYKTFFMDTIEYFDSNPKVATLTTEVADEIFGVREKTTSRSLTVGDLKCVYSFHGGTVFFRKSCFKSPVFPNIAYGQEEMSVAVRAFDNGYYNVYNPDIYINHFPENKWKDKADRDRINVQGASNLFAMKSLLYPVICKPILFGVYILRILRYHVNDKNLLSEFRGKRREMYANHKIGKIKFKTVVRLFYEFGMTTF